MVNLLLVIPCSPNHFFQSDLGRLEKKDCDSIRISLNEVEFNKIKCNLSHQNGGTYSSKEGYRMTVTPVRGSSKNKLEFVVGHASEVSRCGENQERSSCSIDTWTSVAYEVHILPCYVLFGELETVFQPGMTGELETAPKIVKEWIIFF